MEKIYNIFNTYLRIYILAICFPLPVLAQTDLFTSKAGKAHVNGKLSVYVLMNGGWGVTSSFGTWIHYKCSQPSFNISLNLLGSASNLGNRNRYLTAYQINAVLSPMVTLGAGNGLFQQISPFYFGTSSSIYSDYRQSLTLGTNFVVMPRGIGRNITTFRNRTQQLIYIGIRAGGSDWDVILNIYEDFFGTDNGVLQGLADNYDRFYTGGGNLQVRFKDVKAKLYSEIYTGNFQRDLFDNPDLYQPYKSNDSQEPDNFIGPSNPEKNGYLKKTRHPRYVAQEPGQKLFNTGRTFLAVELSPQAFGANKSSFSNASLEVYAGFQGGINQMGVQNYIHSWTKINKVNPRVAVSGSRVDSLQTEKKMRERLHRFYPAYKGSIFIGGAGVSTNLVK
ncbi:hypothetical protein [Dyadobacter sp. 3J3]|uniref:hypothetical protein n=1 Tax=Dyadobacter sp. 3J3 TaxID=2606600 RepID=UPI00135B843B|nr:hypothetical protein [Dyadobacter sp. 3J3]